MGGQKRNWVQAVNSFHPCYHKHTSVTKRVIDVPLEVKAGNFCGHKGARKFQPLTVLNHPPSRGCASLRLSCHHTFRAHKCPPTPLINLRVPSSHAGCQARSIFKSATEIRLLIRAADTNSVCKTGESKQKACGFHAAHAITNGLAVLSEVQASTPHKFTLNQPRDLTPHRPTSAPTSSNVHFHKKFSLQGKQ
ncbi:hypothetical protein SKAU_G00134850 [Synaphobranchus kaupii]|uniref:Uncharacterized protein n=1 Tax=Synaphobranchus kaupii TaxID=118154 RepID=A0A9Q1J2P7_SYNKA|nr:hypothetical protein SKAU_G00134850 [Synaphobranchus kaupii]